MTKELGSIQAVSRRHRHLLLLPSCAAVPPMRPSGCFDRRAAPALFPPLFIKAKRSRDIDAKRNGGKPDWQGAGLLEAVRSGAWVRVGVRVGVRVRVRARGRLRVNIRS